MPTYDGSAGYGFIRSAEEGTYTFTDVPAGDIYFSVGEFSSYVYGYSTILHFNLYVNGVLDSDIGWGTYDIQDFPGGTLAIDVVLAPDSAMGPFAFFWGNPAVDTNPDNWSSVLGQTTLHNNMHISTASFRTEAHALGRESRSVFPPGPYDARMEEVTAAAFEAWEESERHPYEGFDRNTIYNRNTTSRSSSAPTGVAITATSGNFSTADDVTEIECDIFSIHNPTDEEVAFSFINSPPGYTTHYEIVEPAVVANKQFVSFVQRVVPVSSGGEPLPQSPVQVGLAVALDDDFLQTELSFPLNTSVPDVYGLPFNQILISDTGQWMGGNISHRGAWTTVTQSETTDLEVAAPGIPDYTFPDTRTTVLMPFILNPEDIIYNVDAGAIFGNLAAGMGFWYQADVNEPTYKAYGRVLWPPLYIQNLPSTWTRIPAGPADGALKLEVGDSWVMEATYWWNWTASTAPAPLYIMTSEGWVPTALLGPPELFESP